MASGFRKIIADQADYIADIQALLNNNHFNFNETLKITDLPEHSINERIIDIKDPENGVFFLTVIMYKPNTGWWVLKEQHNTIDYQTRPQFFFNFENIFRNPNSYQIGPNFLAQEYIQRLKVNFVINQNDAVAITDNKKNAIFNMRKNIGLKNMDDFVNDNTLNHGSPWHLEFQEVMFTEKTDNEIIAGYGIPFFLVGKYIAGADDYNKITFYKNINARWFFMTRAERNGELTRDIQPAIIAAIVAGEQERAKAERVEADRREAEQREADRREADRREADRREAEQREAERRQKENIIAAIISANVVGEQERAKAERLEAERLQAARVEAERVEAARRQRENSIVAIISANVVGEQERAKAEPEPEQVEPEQVEPEQVDPDAERRDAERRQRENIIAAIIANQPKENNIAAIVQPKENTNDAILTAIIAAIISSNRESSHDYFINHFKILILQDEEIGLIEGIGKINKIINEINGMRNVIDRFRNIGVINRELFLWNPNDSIMYGVEVANYMQLIGGVDENGNLIGDEGIVEHINHDYSINHVNNFHEPTVDQITRLFRDRVRVFTSSIRITVDMLTKLNNTIDSVDFGNDIFGTLPPNDPNNGDYIDFTSEVGKLKYFILLCKYVVFFEKWKKLPENNDIRNINKIKDKIITRFNHCIKLIKKNQKSLYDRFNKNIKLIFKDTFYNSKNQNQDQDEDVNTFYIELPGFKEKIIKLTNDNHIFKDIMTNITINSFSNKINTIGVAELDDKIFKPDDTMNQANIVGYIVTCYYENLKYIIKMMNFIKKIKSIIDEFINQRIAGFMGLGVINNNEVQRLANNDASKQYKENIYDGLERYVRPPQQVAIPIENGQNPVDQNVGRNNNRGVPNLNLNIQGQNPVGANPGQGNRGQGNRGQGNRLGQGNRGPVPANVAAVVPANAAAVAPANQAIIEIRTRITSLQQDRITYVQFENLLKNCYKHGINNYAGGIPKIFKSEEDATLNIDSVSNKNVIKQTLDLLRQGY